jgi:hypothetical protein
VPSSHSAEAPAGGLVGLTRGEGTHAVRIDVAAPGVSGRPCNPEIAARDPFACFHDAALQRGKPRTFPYLHSTLSPANVQLSLPPEAPGQGLSWLYAGQSRLHPSWLREARAREPQARKGRNPATGAVIKIAAKRIVKFRIAKAAKDAILGAKK